MSYTRPTGDAIALQGGGAYSRPTGDAVVLAPTGYVADPLPTSTLGTPAGATGDQYFDDVVLLLHGDGPHQSAHITDHSSASRAVTPIGRAHVSTEQSKYGGASISFQAGGSLRVANHADFQFGTSDFAIEVEVYLTAAPGPEGAHVFGRRRVAGTPYTDYALWIASDLRLRFTANDGAVEFGMGYDPIPLNTWTRIAVQRKGDQLYANPALGGGWSGLTLPSTSYSIGSAAAGDYTIGADEDGNAQFPGFMDELRITGGVARYVGPFNAVLDLDTVVSPNFGVAPPTGAAESIYPGVLSWATSPQPASSLPEGVLGDPTGVQRWPADSLPASEFGTATLAFSAASIEGSFGVPSTPLPAGELPASALGEPSGYQWWGADSLPTGALGEPSLVYEVVPLPTSTIGEPAGWQNYRASSIPVSTFGVPTTPTNRSGAAMSLPATGLGTPVASATHPPAGLGWLVRASSIAPSAPTAAVAAWDLTVEADAAPTGAFGTPLAAVTGHADPLASAPPSDAVALLLQRATGLTGAIGVPLVGRAQTAAGLGPSTFGTPGSAQSDTYVPFPLPSSWFGQPVGFSRFEYPADALPAGVLGEPTAYETHLATSIYSTTEFGIPLLRRDALC